MATSKCDLEIYVACSTDEEDSTCEIVEPPQQRRRVEEAPLPSWTRIFDEPHPPEMSANFALVVVERYLRNAADAIARAEAVAEAEADNDADAESEAEVNNEDSDEMEVDDEDTEEEARPRGMTKEEIRRLPCSQYRPQKHGNQSKECLICLIKFKPRLLLRRLPCLHLFHRFCLDKWLSENQSCPHCRYCALPIDLDPEEICKLMSK